MTRSDIQKLRKAQLMIAKEIRRICEKYNISYFLDAGSMLGAVRHKGFIPWDDDMDFGMCKDDYDIFIKVAPDELDKRFFIDNYITNPKNPYVYSKIRLKGTIYIENIGNEELEHNEIFVDVFPYYYISNNRLIRKIEGMKMALFAQILMSKSGYKVWKGKGIKKRMKFFPIDVLAHIFSRDFLRNAVKKLYNKHDKTDLMCVQSGSCYSYWYFPEKVLRCLIDCTFENELFKIPSNFDYFLKTAYGDYMTLPPESERHTHEIQKLEFGETILI